MKNYDSTSVSLPANFSSVPADKLAGILSTSGENGSFRLQAGDVIVLYDEVVTRTRKVTRGGKDSVIQIPYLRVTVNGTDRLMPFSVLRDRPAKLDSEAYAEYFAGYDLMRSLAECANDLDRYNFLKGVNTLKVAELKRGSVRDWIASPVDTAPDKVQYRLRDFAMLVAVEDAE